MQARKIILAHVVQELNSLFGVYVSDRPVASLQESIHREGQKKLAGLARKFLERPRCRTRGSGAGDSPAP